MTLTTLLTKHAAASLAHNIVSSEQVRTIEPEAAKAAGCSMFDLMQRAGAAAYKILIQHWPNAQSILVVAGNGNNAGDGYVLATLAKQQGKKVVVACQQPTKQLAGEAGRAQAEWQKVGGHTLPLSEVNYDQYDVLVDALLGTGISGDVTPPFQEVIQRINQINIPVLSIDLPSGMQANTGQALPVCVKATVTVTFIAIKPGLISGIAKEFCGQLTLADLAVAKEFFRLAKPDAQLVDWAMLKPLETRPMHSNKGSFGKLLCIGGNQGMSGAIRLSAESALRCGVGLIKVFCHTSSSLPISSGRPEIMLAHKDLETALAWCTCIVIGPGLGQDDWAHQQFSRLFSYLKKYPKPLVIDADALNILGSAADHKVFHNTLAQLPALVLTPHPGEAGRLLDCNIATIERDRYLTSNRIAEEYHATCVLKGAGTIIQAKKQHSTQQCWVCRGGNPGMATAGMGDVLTGVIGAFLAQGLASQNAAVYGVCAHAEAGDRVAKKFGQRGMIASDVIQPLRGIVNGL